MSAYIVSDECINKILGFFNYSNDDLFNYNLYKNLKLLGLDLEKDKYNSKVLDPQLQALGQKLLNLNFISVNQRYNTKDKPTKFIFENIHLKDPIQALKSLNCFLYQSCEGKAENTKIYKILKDISTDIFKHIVYKLKEYDLAVWG